MDAPLICIKSNLSDFLHTSIRYINAELKRKTRFHEEHKDKIKNI